MTHYLPATAPIVADDLWDRIDRDGFAVVPGVLDGAHVDALIAALDAMGDGDRLSRRDAAYAARNLLAHCPAVAELSRSRALLDIVEPVTGLGAFAVRGILFDKLPGANWHVRWHQDRAIAVRERREAAGFGPWSVKAGVTHVEPPAAVLDAMLTVRLHLDDTPADNGALRVMRGSHRAGKLDGDGIRRWIAEGEAVTCEVARGGALLMRPLILHASSPAARPGHRRVVHLEFAAGVLPGGVEWFESATEHTESTKRGR